MPNLKPRDEAVRFSLEEFSSGGFYKQQAGDVLEYVLTGEGPKSGAELRAAGIIILDLNAKDTTIAAVASQHDIAMSIARLVATLCWGPSEIGHLMECITRTMQLEATRPKVDPVMQLLRRLMEVD